MGTGAALAVNLLMGLLDRATTIGALISRAQAEKRDITEAELDTLMVADNTARDKLAAAIAKAKAGG